MAVCLQASYSNDRCCVDDRSRRITSIVVTAFFVFSLWDGKNNIMGWQELFKYLPVDPQHHAVTVGLSGDWVCPVLHLIISGVQDPRHSTRCGHQVTK